MVFRKTMLKMCKLGDLWMHLPLHFVSKLNFKVCFLRNMFSQSGTVSRRSWHHISTSECPISKILVSFWSCGFIIVSKTQFRGRADKMYLSPRCYTNICDNCITNIMWVLYVIESLFKYSHQRQQKISVTIVSQTLCGFCMSLRAYLNIHIKDNRKYLWQLYHKHYVGFVYHSSSFVSLHYINPLLHTSFCPLSILCQVAGWDGLSHWELIYIPIKDIWKYMGHSTRLEHRVRLDCVS